MMLNDIQILKIGFLMNIFSVIKAKKSEKERMRLEKLREKELAKAEKDKEKSAKQRERDAKKMEKEREMLVKRSLQEQKRQLKPGECLKVRLSAIIFDCMGLKLTAIN